MKKRVISAICAVVMMLSQFGAAYALDDVTENEEASIISEEASTELEETEKGEAEAFLDAVEEPENADEESQLYSDTESEEKTEEKQDAVADEPTEKEKTEEKTEGTGEIEVLEFEKEEPSMKPLGEYKISYSVDGSEYTDIPDFDAACYEYEIDMPTDSRFAYIKMSDKSDVMIYSSTNNNPYNPKTKAFADKKNLIGAMQDSGDYKIGKTSKLQFQLGTKTVSSGTDCTVPIKNEQGIAKVTYGGNTYTLHFNAKQPRLLSLTNYMTSGSVVYIGGAGANNDNQTILNSASESDTRMYALGNISKKLVGSSVFMIPTSGIATSTKNKMFSFSGDHNGDVYVLVTGSSAKYNTEAGWEKVNGGKIGTGITVNGNIVKTSRAYNDYTNIEYFAYEFKWACAPESSSTSGDNAYRISSPGISGNTTSTSVKGLKALNQVYKKSFKAGETVDIFESGLNDENMAILVDWGTETIEEVDKLTIERIVDGKKEEVPVSETEKEFSYSLPDNSMYGALKVAVPTDYSAYIKAYNDAEADKFDPTKDKDGNYLIPIVNEKGSVEIKVIDENDIESIYTITFTSKQPKVENFVNKNAGVDIKYVSGAAIRGENAILETVVEDKKIVRRSINGIPAKMQGTSVFVLPDASILSAETAWTTTHADEDIIRFTAPTSGTVYVLTDAEAVMHSEYELLWTMEDISAKLTTTTLKTNGTVTDETSEELVKAYSYKFASGEEVGIPVPEVAEWKGNFAVIVAWE